MIATKNFVIFTLFLACFTSAFIVHREGVPAAQKIIAAGGGAMDKFMDIYGSNFASLPTYNTVKARKPEPNAYAQWYMNNFAGLAL